MSTAGEGEGLGQRIRTARHHRGLSVPELSARVGRASCTVYAWEQGRSLPTVPDAIRLARALGCSLPWLLEGPWHEARVA